MKKLLICITLSASTLISCVGIQRFDTGTGFYRGKSRIVASAEGYLGVKYRHGGTTPQGFDCSGFTMFVYKKNGIDIPRSTKDQFRNGRRVRIRDASPGDLVFFDIKGNGISHVGIYAGNYNFIHAPSTGKTVSYASIKNPYWKKRFVAITAYR